MRRIGFFVLAGLVSGCSSNVLNGNLYTSNIFLLPPTIANSVYLETRNTSDNQDVNLATVGPRLSSKGYQVISDPNQAQYIVQTNTICCNTERRFATMESMVSGGYGGGIGGAISSLGGTIGSLGSMAGMVNPLAGVGAAGISAATGVIGSTISGISNMFGSTGPEIKENITYACVTDLQITERASSGRNVYQTRLVAGVHQNKLDIREATPMLQEKLTKGIAGNF